MARNFDLLRLISYLSYNLIYNSDPQYRENGMIKYDDKPKKFIIKFPIYP